MIWRLTYCNKKGVEARVDIIKGGSTSVEIVEGSANPFTLSYKLDKNDKSGHIMTSSADIEIFETETFNIDDLKTSNETELKVEYFEDNVLTWSGFILPDFFSREIGSPNIVRMTASDRLTALKGITLSDLPAKVSLRDLIELSLAQTGLSLALVAQIQINQGSTNILDSEILSQRLTDVRGRSISCYDILMSIMVATNSTIRQREGQWVVYNKLEHELRTPTIFFDKVERGAIRTIQPVASSVGVYQEFGGNRLHPNNYDFSNGLTNWTSRNGFEADIDNRVVSVFLGGTPIYQPDVTTNDYLVNINNWITDETNLDTAPFLESNNIPIASTQNNTVEIEVDISAVMAEKLSSTTAISFLRYAVIATNGIDTYALTPNGLFEAYDPEKINEHSIILAGGQQSPLLLASPAYTNSSKRKGVLEVDNVNDFHINIRIYGSGLFQYVNVNFASVRFGNKTETPKGNLYKTTQGSNFTKQHDIETVIFGDYIRKGLNGYFYNYPIDDTSNLYLPSGELSSPTWITLFDTTERPLLHHISRQKSRLFSVAHDILRANINVESFDPLAVFQDCRDRKYIVVSARFDFLRSEVDVELEQIAYDNTILKRDFIYSYFGEGEDTIKSIGGIAGGGGGTGGGGMTSEQLAILNNLASWWKLDEENDAIYSEKSIYSLKGVSALGYGDSGGSGGGGIDKLDSWANYTEAKADYYVPASLLVPFRSDTLSRLTSLESGSATSIVTTGSGNAITSLTKSGTVITADKGLTFALASHTHTIAQITGLQGALDLKATQSDIDTAIDSIEIGGRNLLLNSGNFTSTVGWSPYTSVTATVENGMLKLIGGASGNPRYSNYTLIPLTDYVQEFRISVEYISTGGINITGKSSDSLTSFNELGAQNIGTITNLGTEIIEGDRKKTVFQWLSLVKGTALSSWIAIRLSPNQVCYIVNIKVEKGNKATDWTPAPEDQVSDWSETDINSFAFIKNKPTQLSQFTDNIGVATHIANTSNPHNVTKAQVGLGNVDNTADSAKNVLSATKLTTARTIAGVSFDGTADIAIPFANLSSKPTTLSGYGITDAVTLNTAQTITGAKTFSTLLTASAGVNTPKVDLGNGFTIEPSGTELVFKYNDVIKQRMLSDGTILATGGVTALATS